MTDAGVEMTSPVVRRVRAYFAAAGTGFDAAAMGGFAVDVPPSPWIDLGWVYGLKRTCGTKVEAVRAGSPAVAQMQVRTEVEAKLGLEFETWGKAQMALTAGTQQMNLLRGAAVGLEAGSTAMVLQVSDASGFAAGDRVVVDAEYVGQVGFVGAGVSGAYVRTALTDAEYVRRVSLNVARVASVAGGTLTLETPLLAGAPAAGMKVCGLVGYCDREGSSFFQEWAGLFVMEGTQGERVVVFYPRLQSAGGASEGLDGGKLRLVGSFRALPVRDVVDGETVVCFRSYLPG